MKCINSLFLMVLLFASSTLLADGVAVIQSVGSKKAGATVEYKDGDKVRMLSPESNKGYMLVRDGHVYTVANIQGQVMVMDMEKMARMARSMGADSGDDDDVFKFELIDISDTGKTEQIAGYTGKVYRMKWRDKDGVKTSEVVLSNDPDVVEFSHAWMYMAGVMTKIVSRQDLSKNSIGEYLQQKNLGMLRLGKDFLVRSIKPGPLPAERFIVPRSTFKMPSFGG